jgi:hypothetical protein
MVGLIVVAIWPYEAHWIGASRSEARAIIVEAMPTLRYRISAGLRAEISAAKARTEAMKPPFGAAIHSSKKIGDRRSDRIRVDESHHLKALAQ